MQMWHFVATLPAELSLVTIYAGVGVGIFLLLIAYVKRFLHICPPNEVLIFSGGRRSRTSDGRARGFSPLIGGRRWQVPFIQTVDRMTLTLLEVPIGVRNAYSKGGIPMNVDAVANVKISSDPAVIGNAIERFLGRDVEEIRRVAKETLEGHLRGVLATLTPEEINEDRLLFAQALARECEEDLSKLGLHMDTLKITHVTDDANYLNATGRKGIAEIIRAAEIAEPDNKRAAEQAEASNLGRGNVTRANADSTIAKLRNELRRIQADLEAEVKAEEERTAAAAREARAVAEQELQKVRAELEQIRLQADAILPAEADRQAAEFRARGDSAHTRERGRATAEALDVLYGSWQKAGDSALQIALIEDLENYLRAAARGVQKVQIDSLNVIDSGDGQTLRNYIRAYPEMLGTVLEAVDKTIGINISGAISGKPSDTAADVQKTKEVQP